MKERKKAKYGLMYMMSIMGVSVSVADLCRLLICAHGVEMQLTLSPMKPNQ
jgi:hypothetical protein